MKRISSLFTLLLLLSILAACGGTAGEQPPGGSDTQQNGDSGAPADQPVTLRLASWQWEDPAYIPFWQGTTEAFSQEHPNATFERFAFPIDQLWDKLNTEIVAGTPPELLEVTGFNVFQYIDQGVLAPLNDCFAGTDIAEKVKDQQKYAVKDGKMYALNLSARTLQLYVNRKLLDEAGVKVPTNFAELKEAAQKLTDPAKDQYGIVLTNLAHSRLYEGVLLFAAGYGGHYSKDGKPALNSPEVIKGVQFFKDLFDAGVMPKGVKDAGAQYSWFNEGKAAMTIDGAWYWAVLEQQAPETLKHVEVHPIPTDNQAATGGINNLIGIAAGTPHYDIACEYIKFIADPQWGQIWAKNSRTIFPMDGAITEEMRQDNPWFQIYDEHLADNFQNVVPVAPPGLEIYFNDVQKVINTKLVEVLYDNKPVEQAMNEAQAEVEKIVTQ